MKIFALLAILCIQTFAESIPETSVDLEEVVRRKCDSNSNNPNAIKDLQTALFDFRECAANAFGNFSLESAELLDSAQLCKYLKESKIHTCIKDFNKGYSHCLSPTESYLPEMIINAVDALYEEGCGENGVANMDYFLNKIHSSKTDEKYLEVAELVFGEGSCFSDMSVVTNFYKGNLDLSKSIVCSDLQQTHNCITNLLNSKTQGDYTRFTGLIFNPFTQQCNEENNENTI